jgi:ferredoxin
MYIIKEKDLVELLKKISERFDVYVPKEIEDNLHYESFNPDSVEDIIYQQIRSVQPLKTFFFPAQEKVASFPSALAQEDKKPYCLVGVKRCNLESFKVLDFVFKEGDFIDAGYKKLRDENLIIASDCSTFKETCFCLALGIEPYPQENFDLNIARIEEGFIVEIGSSKGRNLVDENSLLFQEATEDDAEKRKLARENLVEQLRKHIHLQGIPARESLHDIVKKSFNSDVWKEEVKTCVECGGCNHICPACHCFILYERKGVKDASERLKIWDSSQYPGFARVAGGANPRKKRFMRLRNRFIKKFVFFPEVLGTFGCTGCGRCIEVCPAKIDIREVLKKLKTTE